MSGDSGKEENTMVDSSSPKAMHGLVLDSVGDAEMPF
jgi:hypothetical protein